MDTEEDIAWARLEASHWGVDAYCQLVASAANSTYLDSALWSSWLFPSLPKEIA